MSIRHYLQNEKPEEIVDDMDNEAEIQKMRSEINQLKEAEAAEPVQMNMDKLAALKAKSQAKQKEEKMASKIIAKKERSLEFGVIGTGQAGSRLAQCFAELGYEAVVCNTAMQDLKFITGIPDSNKLLLEYSLGGAAKELEIGKAAAEANRGEISQLINDKLSNSQVNILCSSLGGGSGAGSCETLVDLLLETGKPLIAIVALPMNTDDPHTKSNSIETLAKLADLTRNKKINNLIIVDNSKLEFLYHNVGQMDFYGVANKAIVSPIDAFNTLSSMPSHIKSLDPVELSKLLLSDGISVYGELTVDNYEDDTSLAEAIISNLEGNLLAGGFDLTQSKYVGFIVAANKEVWSKIPASSVNYASSMVNDLCGSPMGVFKGLYVIDSPEDNVKIYSIFTGLGLPMKRVQGLKDEVKELKSKVKVKDDTRNMTLKLDTGVSESVSAAENLRSKIAQKNSAFGKLMSKTPIDRRK